MDQENKRFHEQINFGHLLFLLVDAVISLLRSLHGLLRCLASSERFAASPDSVRHFNYWLDLSVSVATDTIQLFNYIHLMFMSPLGFNITCFFFFYHIKNAYRQNVPHPLAILGALQGDITRLDNRTNMNKLAIIITSMLRSEPMRFLDRGVLI
ncbi:unnamed protein product [Heligmosomoides polygyrus]|uniref:Transmembrane protein n=1 Tax=Heligmosomoides polygyrus TaxID=6339 RepID=A0A183GA30_HELPZ|nr:unnamed protein product [Heligmosomoides polygyrus]